jgi:hypothetical protein
MIKRLTLLALLACVCVLPLHATTLTLVSEPTGGIGPYGMQLNGVPPTIPMICYSDVNHVALFQTWTVESFNVAGIAASGILGTSFADGSSNLATVTAYYNELGYLASELFAAPGNADLQDAIWEVIPGLSGTTVCDATCTAEDAAAAAAVTGGYTTQDLFWVPINANGSVNTTGPQPFIQNSVAEPGLLLMLGSGLLGLIGLSVRRRNLVSC